MASNGRFKTQYRLGYGSRVMLRNKIKLLEQRFPNIDYNACIAYLHEEIDYILGDLTEDETIAAHIKVLDSIKSIHAQLID